MSSNIRYTFLIFKVTILSRFTFLLFAVCVVTSSPLLAMPLEKPQSGLVAHKAIYDVRMVSQKSGSQVVAIKGKMLFEWKPSCEGYITNHSFNLRYDYADNPTLFINSDFSTFESFDGRTLNFSSRRKKDGNTYDELRGVATLDDKGLGKAVFSIPDGLSFEFTSPTIFSTTHTRALIKAAQEGKKFLVKETFDGSDEEGSVEVSALIGKAFEPDPVALAVTPALVDKAATTPIDKRLLDEGWVVRLAFFPQEQKEESVSDYELTMKFHQNGIISDMVIDYPDFTVHQKLIGLQRLPASSCAPGAPKKETEIKP